MAVAAADVPDVVSSTLASMLPSGARVAVNTTERTPLVNVTSMCVASDGPGVQVQPGLAPTELTTRASPVGSTATVPATSTRYVCGGGGGGRRRAGRDRGRCGAGRRHQVSGGGQGADLVVGGGVEDAEVGAHGERAGHDHRRDAARRDQCGAAVGKSLRHGTDGTDEHQSGSPAVGKGLANGCRIEHRRCQHLGVRVLVVEDDPRISVPLREGLVREGFDVVVVATGADALAADGVDLVLLDLGLPDLDGRVVCRELRARSSVPIIVVTARGEEIDRVMLLELGADDYVVKPFGFRELVARIRAVLRRRRGDRARTATSVDHGAVR